MIKKEFRPYWLKNINEIPQLSCLSVEEKKALAVVANVLPFKTNNYVVEELIDWANIPNDPIFTLNFMRREMLLPNHYSQMENALNSQQNITETANKIRWELNPHPAHQHANIPTLNQQEIRGLQHKYRETVLAFPSQGQTCHAHCTFCFRWPQFVAMNDIRFALKEADELFSYLREHLEVTDVLFTGGDPMTIKTETFKIYIEQLLSPEFSHIQTIRIGTRSLTYWPYRFTTDDDAPDLLRLFERIVKSGKSLAFMAHFNHPVEFKTAAVQEAIRNIIATGAQIRTQSPLLRHINDSAQLWRDMWRTQVTLGCVPYYMFVVRDTGSQHFFSVPLAEAHHIYQSAYQQVSGVCRTVRGPSMSASPGKVHIVGTATIHNEKVFVLEFLQGRNPDWVLKPFFAKYDENAIWLNDLKPAFGENSFFYEEELSKMLE